MVILSANEVPLGLRGFAVFLIGVGGLYLILFTGFVVAVIGEDAIRFGVTSANLANYLIIDVVSYLMPAVFALSSSYALLSQKKIARVLVILYGCTALPAFQGLLSGHPIFLLGITGAVSIYYMWQPRVRAYFEFL